MGIDSPLNATEDVICDVVVRIVTPLKPQAVPAKLTGSL